MTKPSTVVFKANADCYIGGTEHQAEADQGIFGTVSMAKNTDFTWNLSDAEATLYYAAIETVGPQPLPSKMTLKGSATAGHIVHVP